jgi:hypothetical protein
LPEICETKELADCFVDWAWSSVRAEIIAIAFAMMEEGVGCAQGYMSQGLSIPNWIWSWKK